MFANQSVLYQTSVGIISPVELAKEASHVQHGKIMTSQCNQ